MAQYTLENNLVTLTYNKVKNVSFLSLQSYNLRDTTCSDDSVDILCSTSQKVEFTKNQVRYI